MSNNFSWNEDGSPQIGDLVFLANRKVRLDKKNSNYETIICHSNFGNEKLLRLKNQTPVIIAGITIVGEIECYVIGKNTVKYITNSDLIDLNGVRWQQHNSHWKFRLIKRK